MVSRDIYLDGSRPTTEVVLPLHWARSIAVTLVDSATDEPIADTTLKLYLAGWAYRAWPPDSREPPVSSWLASRYKADQFRLEDGQFVFDKVPAGHYTLGFSPPEDCRMFHVHEREQRVQIALPLQEGLDNRFVLTTETLRKYIDANYDLYVSADGLREQIREGINPSAVALLGFSGRDDAQQVLTQLVRDHRYDTQLAAAKAIRWHDALSDQALSAVNYALACANAGMTNHREELDSACTSLLRKTDDGETKTSHRAAEIDMPPSVRLLAVDLGSQYSALRRRAALRLGQLGEDAKPAIPFLRAALEDKSWDFEPWSDSHSTYDFGTVSGAARNALQSLGAINEDPKASFER
jgi:hypothetical protein